MKTTYLFAALVLLMPMCIGYAYQSKQHWRANHEASRIETPGFNIQPEASNWQFPSQELQSEQPKSYQEALQVANATKKNIVLFFSGERFCEPCRKMRGTFADPSVAQALRNYVFYRIDVEGQEAMVARQKGVQGVPTYMVVSPKDQVLKTGTGFKAPAAFLRWLAQNIATVNELTYSPEAIYQPYYGAGVSYFCDECQIWHYRPRPVRRVVNALRWVISPRYRHHIWRQNHVYRTCF